VGENLSMAARPGPGGRCEWNLDRVLAAFPRLAQRLGQCGGPALGGEQQMLAIGRALMTNPGLLFLDEASEVLTSLIAAEIWTLLR
jgi:branched-chain amino acid transport system ATP-binding protein